MVEHLGSCMHCPPDGASVTLSCTSALACIAHHMVLYALYYMKNAPLTMLDGANLVILGGVGQGKNSPLCQLETYEIVFSSLRVNRYPKVYNRKTFLFIVIIATDDTRHDNSP